MEGSFANITSVAAVAASSFEMKVTDPKPFLDKIEHSVPNCGPCPYGHWRQTTLDHALVWSKPSSKRHICVQTVH